MKTRKGRPLKERPTELASYLTSIRIQMRLSQAEVAERIHRSKGCICRIERGQRTQRSLHGSILFELAYAYGASIEDIQRKAHWPQLTLPLDVTDEEMQELLLHLKQMRKKKWQQERQAKE